jgi:hypothetical protein
MKNTCGGMMFYFPAHFFFDFLISCEKKRKIISQNWFNLTMALFGPQNEITPTNPHSIHSY